MKLTMRGSVSRLRRSQKKSFNVQIRNSARPERRRTRSRRAKPAASSTTASAPQATVRTEPLTSWKIRAPSSDGGEQGIVQAREAADLAAQHRGPETGDGGRDGQDGLEGGHIDDQAARGHHGTHQERLGAQAAAVEFGEGQRDQRPGGTDGPMRQDCGESGQEEEGGRAGRDIHHAAAGFLAGAAVRRRRSAPTRPGRGGYRDRSRHTRVAPRTPTTRARVRNSSGRARSPASSNRSASASHAMPRYSPGTRRQTRAQSPSVVTQAAATRSASRSRSAETIFGAPEGDVHEGVGDGGDHGEGERRVGQVDGGGDGTQEGQRVALDTEIAQAAPPAERRTGRTP